MPKRVEVERYVDESGIFAKDQAITQIERALKDRSTYADAFEKAMSAFADALAHNDRARQDFYHMLDEVHATGLLEMVKRHTHDLQYHIAEHAAEVAYDTDISLRKLYSHKFPNDSIKNDMMRHIAIAAAAWHDIIQAKGAPHNELESAKAFSKHLLKKISQFKKQHSELADTITELKKYLDFIADELIVYDTWLVFSLNDKKEIVAKTLRQHTKELDANEHTSPDKLSNTMFQRLSFAADAISISDTSRFALEHVRNEKLLLHSLANLSEDAQAAIARLFHSIGMPDPDAQEAFLGLMGQDIRMFPELNTTSISHISNEDYQYYMHTLHTLRRDGENQDHIDFKKPLDLFMTTMMKNALQSNIHQEINFARSIGTGIWVRHADDLVKFEAYYALLNDSDKSALGKALFILSTKEQPGRALLMANEAFKSAVKQAHAGDALLTFFHLKDKTVAANLDAYQKMTACQTTPRNSH